ncbi:MAG: NADH-quinone oxidoreductase subunit C [Acidimicrobiales bacterium]
MPSADTESPEAGAGTTDAGEEAAVDEGRSALLEALTTELGDALLDSHLIAGKDLWIRVGTEAWASTADYLRNRQRFRFFDFLSAIDWMPSPYGRSLDAAVDNILEGKSLVGDGEAEDGGDSAAGAVSGAGAGAYAGGETRFQVFARVYSLTTKLGVTIKADVGNLGDPLQVGTWTGTYPGADWHEREAYEMFGITFVGHPGLRKLYLPGDFEGHPMRKDFPLLARLIKPWPGIVDVEPMPGAADEGGGDAAAEGDA